MTVAEKTLLQQLLAVIERLCDNSCKDPEKIEAYVRAKGLVE